MFKKTLALGILLCLVSLAYAQEEKITITTYYPSPYGSYRELRSQRMAIGETWYNGSTVCWEGDANCGSGGQTVIPSTNDVDLIVEGRVGIGTVDFSSFHTHNPGILRVTTNHLSTGSTIDIVNESATGDAGIALYDSNHLMIGNFGYTKAVGPERMVINQECWGTDGRVLNTIINEGGGSVGIGTTDPQQKLHVSSTEDVGVKVTSTKVNGYATFWLENDAMDYTMQIRSDQNDAFVIRDETNGANRFAIDTNGNVSIGTMSPQAKLDVSDSVNTNAGIKLGYDNASPSSAKAGTMRYDGGAKKMEYCDGSNWKAMGGGTTYISDWRACSRSNSVVYNHDLGTEQIMAQILFSTSSSGTDPAIVGYEADHGTARGIQIIRITETTLTLQWGGDSLRVLKSGGGYTNYDSGYCRVVVMGLE